MTTEITHIPYGMMCCVCVHSLRPCNHLDFTKMLVIDVDKKDGLKIVKCTDFAREEKIG